MTFGILGQRGKQPPWKDGDGYVRVQVVGEELWIETVDEYDQCVSGPLRLNEFNAWALVGLISFFIGLKLPASVLKKIKIGVGRPKPPADPACSPPTPHASDEPPDPASSS